MVEVTKPDYLSLVNKGGSGFNVSELVTSMVASEIEPKRILQNSKLEKTENAISGIGYLNSQAATTQGNFSTISGDTFFEISSSNSSAIDVVATDEAKLDAANRIISDVQIAKKMVFEFGGFTDLTEQFSGNLTIDFGSWVKNTPESSTASNTLASGKAYRVTNDITNSDDVDTIEANTDWENSATDVLSSGVTYEVTTRISRESDIETIARNSDYPDDGEYEDPIPVGTTFTVDEGFDGTITAASLQLNQVSAGEIITVADGSSGSITDNYLEPIEYYEFEDADTASNETLTFTNKSLSQIAALFDDIEGISAQIIDATGDGTNYSLVLSSENTGFDNGFRIVGEDRWTTSTTPDHHPNSNNFSQLGNDASFKLDGIQVTRSSNNISDIIEGAEINLKADTTGDAAISISRSETAIRQSINDTIFSLNEFKDEIDRLTFIDIEGDENGPLALETAATMLKTNFKKLAIEPLVGYGSDAIYLSQLGIKTNSNGEYYLDETIFEKTLSNNPAYFLALKDANLSSNSASATVTKSQFTSIPAGNYTISKDTSNNWLLGDTALTQVDLADGGSQFTSVTYPGLVIKTADRVPAEFDVYVGKSFAQKMIDLMTDTLDLNSSLRSAEDSYKSLTEDIEARLEKLDEREKLISSRYTEQFGAMEQAMTQFNSTKSMLENFIESWKKQK